MNVIIVNESIKKAKKSARRILSDYLPNIGRDTWSGSITLAGLNRLKDRLNGASNKNMSVACHVVSSRKEIELAWVVGNRDKFDSEGNFAFRFTACDRKYIEMTESTQTLRNIIACLCEIAGYFHDIGKGYYFFQYKLDPASDSKSYSDPERHEFLSYKYFIHLFGDGVKRSQEKTGEKTEYLAGSIDGAMRSLRGAIKSDPALNLPDLGVQPSTFFTIDAIHSSVKIIAHLILTHHKLGDDFASLDPFKFVECVYTYNYTFNDDAPEANKDQTYAQQKWILQEKELTDKIIGAIDRLLDYYERCEKEQAQSVDRFFDDEHSAMLYSHYMLRPLFIVADQSFSSRQMSGGEVKDFKITPFANLKDNNTPNQTLLEHLSGVGKLANKTARFAMNSVWGRMQMNTVDASEVLLAKVPAKYELNYGWQDASARAIAGADIKAHDGFLGIVMAKTGAGKTRANVKIMSALSDYKDLRFSCLLGMKSLTLQTFDEITEELKLAGVVGLIGSSETQKYHDINNSVDEEIEIKGEGVSANREEDSEYLEYSKIKNNININYDPKDILNFKSKRDSKLKKMIDSPVVVSTIDYLINGMNADRSSKTRFLVRMMTSDLIIDEIDAYNMKQFTSVLTMIYLAGLYGRRVIVSSATLSQALSDQIRAAYVKGFGVYQKTLDLQSSTVHLGLFCHESSLCQVINAEKDNDKLDDYYAQFLSAIEKDDVKRRVEALDISGYVGNPLAYGEVFSDIVNHVPVMHDRHHCVSEEGIRVSTGVIKFSNTRDTAWMASNLLSGALFLGDDYCVLAECYHSRQFEVKKSFTERELKTILTRKKGDADFLKQAVIKRAIKEAKKRKVKNIIILVITTPIIETGRDFDFDWAITEPVGHRELIQLSGRVLRHRDIVIGRDRPNIAVLSHSLKLVRSADLLSAYSMPGPEQEDYRLSEKYKKSPFYSLFEYKKDGDRIDASVTLRHADDPGPIRGIEQLLETVYLQSKKCSFSQLTENTENFLTAKHPHENRFRERTKEIELFYNVGKFYVADDKNRLVPSNRVASFDLDDDLNAISTVVEASLEEILSRYEKEFNADLPISVVDYEGEKTSRHYSEKLGIFDYPNEAGH